MAAYPLWQWAGPAYGHVLYEFYERAAPIFEHPARTIEVRFSEGTTHIRTERDYPDFQVTNKNLFIDLPVLFALALATPGLSWTTRVRLGAFGFASLAFTHFTGFVCAMHLNYADIDLVREGIRPGLITLYGISSLRRLLYSDVALVLPFLIWGALYLHATGRSQNAS